MKKNIPGNQHKKATANDVAKRVGVSKWTVSRAFTTGASIQEGTRARVLKAAEELGYRPNLLARSLSQKRTHIIGVTIDELKNPHLTLLLDEVTRQLQQRGYMALLLNVSDKEKYADTLALAYQLQVDGILFMATDLTAELIAIARDMHHIPLIQIGRSTLDSGIEAVSVDGYRAGHEIAGLLIGEGYRRFGYMKGPDTASTHLMRLEGYQARLGVEDFAIDTLLVAGSYDRSCGYRVMANYLKSVSETVWVDAIFCENDILAIGAMQAIKASGRNGSIAVVGFDDIDEASAPEWQLTTYDQRKKRLIEEALNRLIDGIAGDESHWRVGELKLRSSHKKQ